MKTIVHPPKDTWRNLAERPVMENRELENRVREIMLNVKEGGDKMLLNYRSRFDRCDDGQLVVPAEDIRNAEKKVSRELKDAIHLASGNIEKFHSAQRPEDLTVTTMAGVVCSRKAVPVERVGLYVPGGTAPLFSTVLMLAVPARLAGCSEVIICTPPGKDGKVHPAILYAASISGVTSVYSAGGAHAIAAMTFGTETIRAADKLFGPGNQYVTMAKQLASMWGTPIDLPAGPSEVAIIADRSTRPEFVSADILSQAEHGEDSQVILTVTDENILPAIYSSLEEQVRHLPRRREIEGSLKNSLSLVFENRELLMEFINLYAPEHLIISSSDYRDLSSQVRNAGSVFLGSYTPESVGDYASGTNHTLPTNGFAKAWSGVSLESFMKKITFQEVSSSGLPLLGNATGIMADAEDLAAHKLAVDVRLEYIKKSFEKPWEPSIH